ncbi:peptidoglycan DD-metalloendopeptidase family protein [Methylosinus sporium]|uniref:Peptidoglycan DD-metalloendopeptidase family protein n=1 Tax=Methylosinus sporium TaxID=428 RepID=A0A549SMC2_METSR|nr:MULTISPECIES: peptidoglycan DD-metalloendopeptidase family protein [Methylosinus]MBU3887367.1 peptidoglycan DD-metalloendopeptidase family protein [Methylosinus sp. KRF6]TRL30779.1 peptidoglycan DD-metalloendopeptidase family protein [Methylosinus sporium]
MFAAGAAGLLAGCSDASRFTDPFTNPFQDSAPMGRVDRVPTGTNPVRRSVVERQPLAPPPAAIRAPAPVAAAPAPAPVQVAAPAPARAAGAYNHWSAEGGTPVIVAEGESAGVVATRYGVPLDALLRVNGYGKPAEVHPGSRLVIPIYRASAAAAPVAVPAPARAAPVYAAPAQVAQRAADVRDRKAAAPSKPVSTERPRPAPVKQAQIEAKPAPVEPKSAVLKPAVVKQAVVAKPVEAKPAPRQIAQAPAQPAKAAQKPAETHPARAQLAQRTKEQEPVKAKLARAEPAKPEVRAEKIAKKKPEPTPVKEREIARAPQAEKPQRYAEAAPAPQPQALRSIDKTPTASIPSPAQPAEEKSASASADARPEFRWPARGRIIQGFATGGNDGINIAVPEGTQVKAAEGGVVAYAGSELKGYGNLVLIRHPNGFVSAYAHNGELDVKRGDQVKRGQTIAKSGQSGNVGSPQLHFELRKGATPVDPTGYLAGL